MGADNRLAIRLTATDQTAVRILKESTGATTTTAAVREGLRLAISTIQALMKAHGLQTTEDVRQWLVAQSAANQEMASNIPDLPAETSDGGLRA